MSVQAHSGDVVAESTSEQSHVLVVDSDPRVRARIASTLGAEYAPAPIDDAGRQARLHLARRIQSVVRISRRPAAVELSRVHSTQVYDRSIDVQIVGHYFDAPVCVVRIPLRLAADPGAR
jgi:hypothetical protein